MKARTTSERVLFLAAPLMARSGVYRSTFELVQEARRQGLEWDAFVGVRPSAAGSPAEMPGFQEFTIESHGLRLLHELHDRFTALGIAERYDHVISMIPQSDIALSRLRNLPNTQTVSWARGTLWPDKSEASWHRRLLQFSLERHALKTLDRSWATTSVLAEHVSRVASPELIKPGVAPVEQVWDAASLALPLVWAGRVDVDKNPHLFLDICEKLGLPGILYGTGPSLSSVEQRNHSGVVLGGWKNSSDLWRGGSIFLGTSTREAFGRSAVEAALAGLPVVLGSAYGCANLLYTEPDLFNQFVIDVNDKDKWCAAVSALKTNPSLAVEVSNHVSRNARALSIDSSVRAVSTALINNPLH